MAVYLGLDVGTSHLTALAVDAATAHRASGGRLGDTWAWVEQ